jgi:hypothetical protein
MRDTLDWEAKAMRLQLILPRVEPTVITLPTVLNDAIFTFPRAAKKKSSAESAELLLTQ